MTGRGQDSFLPQFTQPIYDSQQGIQIERCSSYASTDPQFQFGGAVGLRSSNAGAFPLGSSNMPFTELLSNMHPLPPERDCLEAVVGVPFMTHRIGAHFFEPDGDDECCTVWPTSDNSSFLPRQVQTGGPGEVSRSFELYDLNLPPAFAPITPEKATREHRQEVSEVENLAMNSYCYYNRTDEQNQQQNGLVNIDFGYSSPPQSNMQNPATDSSLAAGPSENNPDTVLLSETPQPKQRRKKHRPKVITERKPRKRKPAEERPTTAQDKPTGKRKYVRRNKLTEGMATPLEDTNGETVQRKRTYARKKAVSKEPTAATTDETGVGTSDVEVLEPTKKTCRRALNFDMDQVPPKRSSPNNSQFDFESQNLPKQQNGSTSTTGCSNVLKMREQAIEVGISCSVIGSHNQVDKDYLLLSEQAPRTPLPPKNNHQQGGLIAPSQMKKYTSEIYEKTSTGQANINNSTCILKEKNASEPNGCGLSTDEQVDATRTNLYGSLYNSLLAYKAALRQQLLPNQKRKRSEKGQQHASSPTVIRSNVLQGPFFLDNRMNVHGSEVCGSQADIGETERKDYNRNLQAHVLEQTNSVRKKRSKGNTRIRGDFASLNIMTSLSKAQTGGNANTKTSCTSMGELLAKMDSKLAKKKRTKKSPITPAYSSNDEKRRIIISNQNGFPTNYIGPPEVMWNQIYSIDAIIEMLRHLQICEEVSNAPYQQSQALVSYNMGRYDSAIVPYRDGTIIPFDPAKKRRPRPKVDLDDETNRVWKLLLGNINSEGIDGNDEEKAKWWEEERRVFRGRADSFIARMHLVQGDRRFSPWKGSVLDSVVGVFLTQNVSDHLSSSAFMSMAAHFPVKQKGKEKFCEDGTSLSVLQPKYYVSDPEEISKWNENESVRQIGDQSSMTLHSSGQLEREADDSNESSVCGINSSGLICESRQELPHSSGSCFDVYNHCRQNGSITDRTTRETEFSKRDEAIDEVLSQNSVISSQDSTDFPIVQTVETPAHYTQENSGIDEKMGSKISFSNESTFVELLQMFGSNMVHDVYVQDTYRSHVLEGTQSLNIGASEGPKCLLSGKSTLSTEYHGHADVNTNAELLDMFKEQKKTIQNSNTKDLNSLKQQSPVTEESVCQSGDQTDSTISNPEVPSSADNQINETIHQNKNMKEKGKRQLIGGNGNVVESSAQRQNMKSKNKKAEKEKKEGIEWDYLRKQVESNGKKRERTESSMDSVDWEAVRCADVDEIAQTIKERGMNNMLAERIKDFLNRLISEHGSIDLEWLRDVPPDKAKEYLLSVRGLGLKSVECVRLLTLHHLAFPVDTNVGRIAVRLGWVPLQPLPESLQLHLLELYPILESIQKYLWPRLCKLDQRTLYELHYQLITFGKVFCTKSKPNCNACPMRGECRHFASAFASARLALPGPEEKGIIIANENRRPDQNHTIKNPQSLLLPQLTEQPEGQQLQARYAVANCEPIIEEPATPEPECMQAQEVDIEDTFCVDDEIPKIELNMKQLSQNLMAYVENNMELQESDLSKALVALTAEAASMPAPKLKNINRLRTEHHVYELPDSHPLLNGMDKREADDPCKYLLAIWTPGETPNSIQPPEKSCSSQEHGFLCMEKTCFSCNNKREAESQIVRGTLLIPCRTAMRGSFPLNGTYFQVNEVFADHKSSLNPIEVPRNWLWNLPRRTVYFGTSIPTIFKGLTTEGIQHCFWRGFVCVRGFDQKTRAPRPLIARLHFPASKLAKGRGRGADEE